MSAKIVWFTGLSGSGKTTLAKILIKILKNKYKCLHIDGDNFRKKRNSNFKLNKKDIIKNNEDIIFFCKKIINKYDYIIVSVLSPLLQTRVKAKKYFGNLYKEVYVKAHLKDLILRDTKSLYKKALTSNFKVIGFNSKIKYEISNYKKIIINTSILKKKYCIKKIIKNLSFK